jgi:hypothetical protein
MAKAKKITVEEKPKFVCEFCKKSFSRESTIVAHTCERKRRWLMKDERHVKLGFHAYQKFYQISMKSKKARTYEDFMDSQYYTAFIKFGKHLISINAIEAEGFVEFLIKANVKLENWTNEVCYESWVRELAKKESPDKAVERNILLMEQWARDYDENWIDFFRKVPTPLATRWIRTGRISPWLLYCGVGDVLFDRMSDEQLEMVREWINPLYWQTKMRNNQVEVERIRAILQEAGV